MTTTSADLWHHYGRARAADDRGVPGAFRWSWDQGSGPGAERLGELGGRVVGDLGAGAGRHAAHLAVHLGPARVAAIDSSPAQHTLATDLYGHLAPRLRPVHADVVEHLRTAPACYDVLYSVFGALDFTEPADLLPAAATALRPGGRLVFSTLARHLDGAPARSDATPADISARTPEGRPAAMRRWVLQEHVWAGLLHEAGFTHVRAETLPAVADGPRAAPTLLVTASRPDA